MKFTLTIEMDNDAMKSYDDVANALAETADKIRDYEEIMQGETGRIMDLNGNAVGRWVVTNAD